MGNKEMEYSIERVTKRIIEKREEKGFSLENMAHELNISMSAYNKIEKMNTKLTLQRFFKIAQILEVDITELLEIDVNYQMNQTNRDKSTGYLQQIDNFYQESKDIYERLIEEKDKLLDAKDKEIERLRLTMN